MKIKKNYKLWGLVFICFVGVWIWRTTTVNNYKASSIEVKKKITEREIMTDEVVRGKAAEEVDIEKIPPRVRPSVPRPPPSPAPSPSSKAYSPPPITTPEEPIDIWGWVVKMGGALAGLKTLLDIVDKFRSRKLKPI